MGRMVEGEVLGRGRGVMDRRRRGCRSISEKGG